MLVSVQRMFAESMSRFRSRGLISLEFWHLFLGCLFPILSYISFGNSSQSSLYSPVLSLGLFRLWDVICEPWPSFVKREALVIPANDSHFLSKLTETSYHLCECNVGKVLVEQIHVHVHRRIDGVDKTNLMSICHPKLSVTRKKVRSIVGVCVCVCVCVRVCGVTRLIRPLLGGWMVSWAWIRIITVGVWFFILWTCFKGYTAI